MFPITVSMTFANEAQLAQFNQAVALLKGGKTPESVAKTAPKDDPKKEADKAPEVKSEPPTPAAAPTAAPASTPSTAEVAAAPETKALDYAKNVAPAIRSLCRAKGNDAGKAMLAEFKVENGQELKPEQYAAVVQRCAELEKA